MVLSTDANESKAVLSDFTYTEGQSLSFCVCIVRRDSLALLLNGSCTLFSADIFQQVLSVLLVAKFSP